MQNLTEENFISYAYTSYNVPHYIEQEFHSDLKRIKYIKRLFQKYEKTGILKGRLILNHLILLYNVFETRSCTKMLFLKIHNKHHSLLKTFLTYLNYMPIIVFNVNGKNIISTEIQLDKIVMVKLNEL